MDNLPLLQAYGARLPKRVSDAEYLDNNIYASPEPGPMGELDPRGLLDRLYRQRFSGQPMNSPAMPAAVPTTKSRYM